MTFKEYDFLIMGPPSLVIIRSSERPLRSFRAREDAHCYNSSNELEIELIVDI